MKTKHIRLRKWVKILFFLILSISFIYTYSRYFETKQLEVKEEVIIDSNIPNNFYGLKIVQLSDIHYKVTTTKDDLKNIVKEINLIKPDVVVLSGDLFDSNIKYSKKDYEDLKEILKSIDFNIVKYAIKGEDDINIKNWEDIINESNFTDLNNNYEFVYSNGVDPILFIGISSNYKKNHIKESLNSIYKQLNTKYQYSILILHEPDVIKSIDYSKFNLILAGHSHNGQIYLPFIGGIIKDKYAKKYLDHYYELDKTKLYISSGIGTTKYKVRFLNKPSINLYRLRNK